jgi:DNA-binding NarL/FixJ family response regulator
MTSINLTKLKAFSPPTWVQGLLRPRDRDPRSPASVRREQTEPPGGPEARPEDRRTVCLFDDHSDLESLSGTLWNLGYRVVSAADPRRDGVWAPPAGLDAAIIGDTVHNPLQLSAALCGSCPILLVTTDTSFQHRLAAARSGVDAILPKPVDVAELAGWLEEFVGPRLDSPFSILIVDDD